jgi:hypothetical protein
MEELNKLNNDELSQKSAELVRKLLNLEVECAQGGQTYNSSVEEYQENALGGEDHSFHLKIPYFGTVKLAYDVPPAFTQSPEVVSGSAFGAPLFNQYSTGSYNAAIVQPGDPQNSYTPQSMPLSEHIPAPHEHYSFPMAFQGEYCRQFDSGMPELMANAENWAFQGVDSAFFDTLMSGIAATQTTESGNWGGYIMSS